MAVEARAEDLDFTVDDDRQVLTPGQIAGRVVEPDMQLRLELVDDHGAALDDIGPVVDQVAQLTQPLIDPVPARPGVAIAANAAAAASIWSDLAPVAACSLR